MTRRVLITICVEGNCELYIVWKKKYIQRFVDGSNHFVDILNFK